VHDVSRQPVSHGQNRAWGASSETHPTEEKPQLGAQARADISQPSQGHSLRADPASTSIVGSNNSAAPQQARGSRFFPSRDTRQEAGLSSDDQRPQSPSPPPPDMAGHPAFDGDAARPHVSLPPPQPVVRLPPEAVYLRAPPPTEPSLGWAEPAPHKEEESAPVTPLYRDVPQRGTPHDQGNLWQSRIDNLLGVKSSSPSKSFPVASASRHGLEHNVHHHTANVSLPDSLSLDSAPDTGSSVTSKLMAEECFEEQEMGSVPPVRLPTKTPDMAWQPSPPSKPLPKKLWASVTSVEPLQFTQDLTGSGNVIKILFPGMNETKNVTVPFGRTRSNPRRGGRGGTRHTPQPHRGGGKERDNSSSFSNDPGFPSMSAPNPRRQEYRGRSGYRRDENWSRPRSLQV
jgi:hypothetical protein